MRTVTIVVIGAILFTGLFCTGNKKGIEPVELTVEYRTNPINVEKTNPRMSWILKSDERNQAQTAYQIIVASSEDKILNNEGDLWDSGRMDSDKSVHVEYKGKKLQSRMRCWWRVRVWDKYGILSGWSEPGFWAMGLLKPEDRKAEWIGYESKAAPMFRKEIDIEKPVKDARIYICGLGYYELSINGTKIGDHVLDPAQTDYEQRAYYVVYDVSHNFKQGENAVGVVLGNGWYNQNVVNNKRFGWGDVIYGQPRLTAQIHILYADGTKSVIITDKSWKCSTGPIVLDNIYLGEFYDARLEKPGWNSPGYDDAEWENAEIVESLGGRLVSQKVQPIKKIRTIKPIGIKNPKPGVFVYNLGQNFAGWVKLKVQAKKGTTIQLRFAETVFDDGMIDPASTGVYATDIVQTDKYTCKGGGLEVWEPRFTYHGFQYVEMTGFPGTPSLGNIEGVVVNTAVGNAGTFKCSDEMINRIHWTAVWTTLNNFHGIVTDCPHRERCQWLGDIIAELSFYNFNAALLYSKFVRDIETGRRGEPPNHIAPGRRTGGTASSDWGSTFIQVPYYLYLYYGDISIAREHYDSMVYFMEYLQKRAKDYVISEGWGDLFEPGSVRSKRTPSELTSTAFFYYDAILMSKMAEVLGKNNDSNKYKELAEKIRTTFINRFYDKNEKTFGSQTADALALNFGLVPEGNEKSVAESLNRDVVEKHDGHHSTGHMGTRYIYGELSRFGYGETAQTMLNQTTYPSFGELFLRGATTIWEYWGEKEIDETSNGTRSQNHPFQGGFDAWFYNGIAGINPDPERTGFKHIILKPQLIGDLTYAIARFHSIYGMIISGWKKDNETLEWDVSVPVNTTATLYVPAESSDMVTEGGRPADKSEGLTFIRMNRGNAVYTAGSGNYRFIVKRK